jgi:hypothetical protein
LLDRKGANCPAQCDPLTHLALAEVVAAAVRGRLTSWAALGPALQQSRSRPAEPLASTAGSPAGAADPEQQSKLVAALARPARCLEGTGAGSRMPFWGRERRPASVSTARVFRTSKSARSRIQARLSTFFWRRSRRAARSPAKTLAVRESLITIKRSSSAEPMRHDSVCYCTRFKFCAAIRVICIPSTWRAASRSKAGRSLLLHQRSSSASASPFSILPNDLLIKVQFYEGRSWANEACSFVRRNSP